MKTISAILSAAAVSGCAALAIAGAAAEVALILVEDSGEYENLGVMQEDTCEVTARSLNKSAWSEGQQVNYVCVPIESVSYDYDVIMED